MRRWALIFSLIQACASAYPLISYAGDEALVKNAFRVQSDSATRAAWPFEFKVQNKLLRKLIDQKVSYQLDETSSLNFSCNLASRSGKVELVVKF